MQQSPVHRRARRYPFFAYRRRARRGGGRESGFGGKIARVLDKRRGCATQTHSLAKRPGECDEHWIWLVEPIENLHSALFDKHLLGDDTQQHDSPRHG